MTLQPTRPPRVTIEEYLRLEADSVEKHEYRDGAIVAMAGGSPQHSLVIMNFGAELRQRLKGKPCRVYDSNLRIALTLPPLYTYPDLSIICGPIQFDPHDFHRGTAINPCVLIEVLSPSSEGYDRGEKFRRYLEIESLQEYVLVSQARPSVETFYRQPDGTWLFAPAFGPQGVAKLRSLDVEVPFSEIYADVEFPPVPELPLDPDGFRRF